jgi:hypothetical protein
MLFAVLVLLGATAVFVARNRSSGQPPQQSKPPPIAVRAAAVVRKTVPVQLTAIGTVQS